MQYFRMRIGRSLQLGAIEAYLGDGLVAVRRIDADGLAVGALRTVPLDQVALRPGQRLMS